MIMYEKNEAPETPEKETEQTLGAPDFSSILCEEPEITSADVNTPKAKAPALGVGDAIAMISGILFNFVAMRKGEHWRLSEEEASELGEASQDVILEYFPDFKGSPLLVLGGVSTAIVAPRFLMDAKIKQDTVDQVRKQGGAESADTSEQ